MRMIDFTKQLVEGTLEYTIDYLFEKKINLDNFDKTFSNDKTGAPAYSPKTMLKIILYAYANGILGSRKIEKACLENVTFMTLAGGHIPHFTYIADFVHRFEEEIKGVFKEVLLICWELGLVGGEFLAIDGCKLPSNAAKEWSGTFSDLKKKEDKIRKTIKFLINKHNDTDRSKEEKKADKKQIEKIEAKAEKIKSFLEENKPRIGPRGNEIQSNITDNQSARLKSSHGWVQGYNGMAMVDAKKQVIVNAEVFGGNNESMYLVQFLDNTKTKVLENELKGLLTQGAILADTGFFSVDNLKYLSDENIDAYIPDQFYRKRDPRFATKARHNTGRRKGYFTPAEFTHNSKKNEYTCPGGKTLLYKGFRRLGNAMGDRYESNPIDCKTCSLRSRCLRSEKSRLRIIFVSQPKYGRDYVKEMITKIDTDQGRNIYSKRMGIVEPAYANICHAKGMDRFNYRTKGKVNSQWLLYCMVHNIGKIANSMKN